MSQFPAILTAIHNELLIRFSLYSYMISEGEFDWDALHYLHGTLYGCSVLGKTEFYILSRHDHICVRRCHPTNFHSSFNGDELVVSVAEPELVERIVNLLESWEPRM